MEKSIKNGKVLSNDRRKNTIRELKHAGYSLAVKRAFMTTSAIMGAVLLIISIMIMPACAQSYPSRPITIIATVAPGGTMDISCRVVAAALEKEFGKSVQVVNKPGATGQIALTEAALAKPDGYTMVGVIAPDHISIYLDPGRKAVPQIRALQQVACMNMDVGAVIVSAESPYRTVKDLVDAAKAKPGGLVASTGGLMGSDHMLTMYFMKKTGTNLKVMHTDGGGPAMTAILGGHSTVRFGKVGSAYSLMKSGKLRIIGVMDKVRSKYTPDSQTMEEAGYKDYRSWGMINGLAVPKDTPRAIVDILGNAVKKALNSKEITERFDKLGLEVRFMGPDEFAAYWQDYEKTIEPLVLETKKQ